MAGENMAGEKMKNYFLSGFVDGFKSFSHFLAGIVNFILLLVVYILGVGIVSVIAKAIGKKFLELRPNRGTNWTERNDSANKDDYYRQF